MADVSDIVSAAVTELMPRDLRGHIILVTAGPTREPIDPVRFISNRSSGKMGFALARAAVRRGAEVTLVSGPSSEKPPQGVSFVPVERASQMESAVMKHLPESSSVIMSAAVSDIAPLKTDKVKLKKTDVKSLELKQTNDILKKIGRRKGSRVLIGFAAESSKDINNARNKLKEKNLDLVVLNDVTQKGAGFDIDTNIVTIIDKTGESTEYPLMKKTEIADIILDRMLQLKT
jgi:phosphopantothenoylcysteine decarboxylase/phosphopantothenate--cysteine ligase